MGWNVVVKKIKGKSYAYRQMSYREGGKVRTKSEFLGPVTDSQVASDHQPDHIDNLVIGNPFAAANPTNSVSETATVITTNSSVVSPITPLPDNPEHDDIPSPYYSPDECIEQIELPKWLEDKNVSIPAMYREYQRCHKHMVNNLGIDAAALQLEVVAGSAVKSATSWTGARQITFPKKGAGARTKFKAQYRKEIAKHMLDQFKAHQPALYNDMCSRLSDGYWSTRWNMLRFAMTNSPKAGMVMLSLQIFCSSQLPKSIASEFKGKYWGIQETGGSKKQELIGLVSEVIRNGYTGSLRHYQKECAKSDQRIVNGLKRLNQMTAKDVILGRKRRQMRKIKQELARLRLMRSYQGKLQSLQPMFENY